jgi:hypothetical protein
MDRGLFLSLKGQKAYVDMKLKRISRPLTAGVTCLCLRAGASNAVTIFTDIASFQAASDATLIESFSAIAPFPT